MSSCLQQHSPFARIVLPRLATNLTAILTPATASRCCASMAPDSLHSAQGPAPSDSRPPPRAQVCPRTTFRPLADGCYTKPILVLDPLYRSDGAKASQTGAVVVIGCIRHDRGRCCQISHVSPYPCRSACV
ncbi:hypothetical protein FA95DRAFT_1394209 [Auriscalpium vulgare]|uniref:Uncharacterized protein n=1 Tax=Auriscalpium vulgare TaxID=40419 RepID=A0ACB8RR18_9AGAM|nr:hypothetical protein FA95DRAFT_1394209 [Auriscalpium vulgare]